MMSFTGFNILPISDRLFWLNRVMFDRDDAKTVRAYKRD